MITPLMFYVFCTLNKRKIKAADQEVALKYGTLFDEFNMDQGLTSSQFYMFFFFKRLFYIWILILVRNYPILQLILNILLSIIVKNT